MTAINIQFYENLVETMVSLRLLVRISEELKESGFIVKDSKITDHLKSSLRELEKIYFS